MSEIGKMRMQNQFFTPRTLPSTLDVLEYFVAFQAQEYEQTKWGLSLRNTTQTEAEIEDYFNTGKILRTHLLRPTWHFVSHHDIAWLLPLSSPIVNQVNKYMYKKLELDESVFSKALRLISEILAKSTDMTREEIKEVLGRNGIVAEGHRLSYIMMKAELEGLVASGPRRGKQFTYKLLDSKIGNFIRDEALALLASKYFLSRGPATVSDFSTWSGLSMKDARAGIANANMGLRELPISGEVYYCYDVPSVPGQGEVFLLPIYDEYIMGYKDRSMYFSFDHPAAWQYDCMIMVDGQVIGTWKRTLGKEAEVFLDIRHDLDAKTKALLDQALHRFELYYGLPLKIV